MLCAGTKSRARLVYDLYSMGVEERGVNGFFDIGSLKLNS